MVKTKSVYDPVEQLDADRILITRYWPRGISKARIYTTDWLTNLAPSKELLRDWKDRKDFVGAVRDLVLRRNVRIIRYN